MRKIDERRRQVFLDTLTATGNATLAAERAKVSRSWAVQAKRNDAGFRAACVVAAARAGARLAAGKGARPPAGIIFEGGEELVLTWGTGGGPVQAMRARLHQWTPRIEQRFLAALARTANVSAACRAVGLSTASAYRRRGQYRSFAVDWDAALARGVDAIESGLLRRAEATLSGDWDADCGDVPPMSIDDMLQVLRQHHERSGGRNTRENRNWRRPRDSAAVRASILKKLAAIERQAARESPSRATIDPASGDT